ncbi:DUF1501 domain-containing protein [Zavarzinella formosa]|uniref:DUF1501 domain-containing protein n=1 Tax=Zavarzinella formosa TaxID=360055 RepID=UPI0003125A53|nr:DUF1501 domain-containing protein [Zavarzinella formosa]
MAMFRDHHTSRREFLRLGALGVGGLTLADVLRLRAQGPTTKKTRAVIMVCLAGGPSHLDMYDLKPGAPDEIRGEFKPVRTVTPGFDICEHFPLQAKITDKLALVRSLQFVEPMQHELEEVYTGFPKSMKRPSFGAVVSRFKGAGVRVPSYVSLEYSTGTSSYESPQYAGAAHRALHISGGDGVRNLGLLNGISRARLDDRRGLLHDFDTYRREQDARRESQDMDAHTAKALDIITAPRVRDAFDLSREPEKVKARYGDKDAKFIYAGKDADSFWYGHNFLLARRLVEAGVPVVTLRAGLWDHHGNVIQQVGGKSIWHSLKSALPLLDQSVHALVTDLHDRGLSDEVLVLIWGEFGRTPKISQTGRDHWPDASFALFAGAGCHGQVIGETDSRGERPKSRPLGPQNVLGTIYHTLGIDYRQTLTDFSGRPIQLLDDGEPIAELVG